MDQLLALGNAYARDLIIILSIFAAVYVLIGFLFARDQSLRLLKGLLVNFVWIFASPFLYVKKTIGEIAGITSDSAHRDTNHDQYLITRFLFILRAAVVLIAIGILAASVAKGYEDFLPAQYLRMAAASAQETLDTLTKRADNLRATIATQDAEWSGKKDELIRAHQQARAKTASDASAADEGIEATLKGDPQGGQVLSMMQGYLQNQPHTSKYAIEALRRNVHSIISQVGGANSDQLRQYADNWLTIQLSNIPEASSESAIRSEVQADYEQNKAALESTTQMATVTSEELAQIRKQEKYDPGKFLEAVIEGILSFIVFVWGFGLGLEGLLIAIFIARDVHILRVESETPKVAEYVG